MRGAQEAASQHCSVRLGAMGQGTVEVLLLSHPTHFRGAKSMNSYRVNPVLGFAGQGRSGRRWTDTPWTARREPTGL